LEHFDPHFLVKSLYQSRHQRSNNSSNACSFRADVIDLQPAVVHILAGINDIGNTGPTDFRNDSQHISMAELAKANQIKVILCSVLPAYDFL
jgi:hypothetical protein